MKLCVHIPCIHALGNGICVCALACMRARACMCARMIACAYVCVPCADTATVANFDVP